MTLQCRASRGLRRPGSQKYTGIGRERMRESIEPVLRYVRSATALQLANKGPSLGPWDTQGDTARRVASALRSAEPRERVPGGGTFILYREARLRPGRQRVRRSVPRYDCTLRANRRGSSSKNAPWLLFLPRCVACGWLGGWEDSWKPLSRAEMRTAEILLVVLLTLSTVDGLSARTWLAQRAKPQSETLELGLLPFPVTEAPVSYTHLTLPTICSV